MIALAAVIALAGDPSVRPWRIGSGAEYRPAPNTRSGEPVGGLTCLAGGTRFSVHIELFANRRAVVIPAGIGVAEPFRTDLGSVKPQGCSYPVRTVAPTGVVQATTRSRLTVGDLFRVWGEPLGTRRLGPFTSSTPVRAYVGGRLVHTAPASIPLRSSEQIVLELGGYVAPHPSFLFPKGS